MNTPDIFRDFFPDLRYSRLGQILFFAVSPLSSCGTDTLVLYRRHGIGTTAQYYLSRGFCPDFQLPCTFKDEREDYSIAGMVISHMHA